MNEMPAIIDLDRLSAGKAHLAEDPPPQPPVDNGSPSEPTTRTKAENFSTANRFAEETSTEDGNALQWLLDDCCAKARLLQWSSAEIEQIRATSDFKALQITQQKLSRELKQAFQVGSLYEKANQSSSYPQLDVTSYC